MSNRIEITAEQLEDYGVNCFVQLDAEPAHLKIIADRINAEIARQLAAIKKPIDTEKTDVSPEGRENNLMIFD